MISQWIKLSSTCCYETCEIWSTSGLDRSQNKDVIKTMVRSVWSWMKDEIYLHTSHTLEYVVLFCSFILFVLTIGQHFLYLSPSVAIGNLSFMQVGDRDPLLESQITVKRAQPACILFSFYLFIPIPCFILFFLPLLSLFQRPREREIGGKNRHNRTIHHFFFSSIHREALMRYWISRHF